jgi:hypothetical protein
MPKNIEMTLWDVIRARKECGSFYRSRPRKAGHVQADEGHKHYVKMLQHFYDTLKPPDKPSEASSNTHEQRTHRESPPNKFDILESEELFCFDDISSHVPQVMMPQTHPTNYEIEQSLEDQLHERAFAVFCFLKDLTAIRLFVHRSWREYKERRICLTTAAMTANIAIEILRRISEAFLAGFPEFNTHDKIVNLLLGNDHSLHISKDDEGWYVLEGFTLSPETFVCEETHRLYFTEFLFKEKFVDDYHNKAGKRIYDSERLHMRRCLGLFYAIATSDTAAGARARQHDLLVQALASLGTQKKTPTWIVFAFQIFVDMHRELGTAVARAKKELDESQAKLGREFEVFIEFQKVHSGTIGVK